MPKRSNANWLERGDQAAREGACAFEIWHVLAAEREGREV